MRDLGTVIVHVDMKHHKVTTEPLTSSTKLPPGVSARFFGNSTQIEYALTEGLFTDLGGTDIEYNIHANVSNLLNFAIGTNSPHTFPAYPQDSMGIYVYFAILPFNMTSTTFGPCGPPNCTVSIDSVDGVYPFTTGTPQPYVFWKTILEGGGTNAQQPGRFETNQTGLPGGINYFRRMSFHTHGNVTDYSFGIAMAAPWVEPNENRWKVFYTSDSLPNRLSLDDLRSEPDWRVLGTGGGAAAITTTGCPGGTGHCLQIVSTTASTVPESLVYYRSDSLRASQDGYIAATMTATPSALSTAPSIFLGLKDPSKILVLGISSTLTGFVDASGAFIAGASVPTDGSRTSFRVSKVGTTSAAIYSPANQGVPLVTIPYASLPAAPARGGNPGDYDQFFFFGNVTRPATAPGATSLWSNVTYEIGVLGP